MKLRKMRVGRAVEEDLTQEMQTQDMHADDNYRQEEYADYSDYTEEERQEKVFMDFYGDEALQRELVHSRGKHPSKKGFATG
jgi:hypothetical protein